MNHATHQPCWISALHPPYFLLFFYPWKRISTNQPPANEGDRSLPRCRAPAPAPDLHTGVKVYVRTWNIFNVNPNAVAGVRRCYRPIQPSRLTCVHQRGATPNLPPPPPYCKIWIAEVYAAPLRGFRGAWRAFLPFRCGGGVFYARF